MTEAIKSSIENVGGFKNTPDEIHLGDKIYTYDKKYTNSTNYICYPFTYETLITQKVHFGKPLTMHFNIEPKILKEIFTKYTPRELDVSFPSLNVCSSLKEVYDDNEELGLKWKDELLNTHLLVKELPLHYDGEFDSDLFYSILPVDDITYRGRIYEINEEDGLYLVVTLWKLNANTTPNFNEIINTVISQLDTSKYNSILVAQGTSPYYVYKEGAENDINIEDNSDIHNLHLLSPAEKKKILDPYITQKDEYFASKLPKDWCMAKYNYWKRYGMGDNKRKRICMTESQIKFIIKNRFKK
jgi:hypothetical protein